MNKKEILENNKLIAEFLGYSLCNKYKNMKTGRYHTKCLEFCFLEPEIFYTNGQNNYHVSNLNYHKNWNKLISVIEAVYKACIKFIKYYNEIT